MWKLPYENVRPDKLLIHLDIWSRQRLNIKWRSQLNGTEQWKAPKRTWDSVGKEQWISSQECWLVFSCKSYQIRSIFLAKLNSLLIQESSDYPCKCNHITNILKHIKAWFFFNPLTSVSDHDRISPYNIKQTNDENKEKYQLGDYKLIQYQILQTNITRTVWENYLCNLGS